MVATDKAAHRDVLEPDFDMQRINHSDAHSLDVVHTNLAERFFSRLRRTIAGQYLRVEGRHLDACAAHADWLEHHLSKAMESWRIGFSAARLLRQSAGCGRAIGNDA